MNRYLLLILLTSWSLLITHSEECDTGVAFTNSVLSIQRSSLANADVALLKSYLAESVVRCMEDCCTGKYGACSVASFKKNATNYNCLHFYCRPLKQCKFLSSTSTDSFTFSSNPLGSHPVPSSKAFNTSTFSASPATPPEAKSQFEQPHAIEEIATFSEQQHDMKNDNKSVKPRKGVFTLTPDALMSKSGIKPRKGVTLEDIPHSKYLLKGLKKSNVKPRKGVGTYSSNELSKIKETLSDGISSTMSNDSSLAEYNSTDDFSANDDLASILANVFEDDPLASSADSSTITTPSTLRVYTIAPTPSLNIYATSSIEHPTSDKRDPSYSTTSSTWGHLESSYSSTPNLISSSSVAVSDVKVVQTTILTPSSTERSSLSAPFASTMPLLSAKTQLSMDEPKSLKKPITINSEESENDKKYKSSIHLVLSLVFGLLVLFAVLGVVAKRIYDGWQRRDYYRMNYLIDGIYNGYE